jgi:hypothetical protein
MDRPSNPQWSHWRKSCAAPVTLHEGFMNASCASGHGRRASAAEAGHEMGLAHQDIKPGDVMMTK